MNSPDLTTNLGKVCSSKPTSGHSLEGVDKASERELRWVLDKQMDVVRFEVDLKKLGFEVAANASEDTLKDLKDILRDDLPPVLRYKDQVSIEVKYNVSSVSQFVFFSHRLSASILSDSCGSVLFV